MSCDPFERQTVDIKDQLAAVVTGGTKASSLFPVSTGERENEKYITP